MAEITVREANPDDVPEILRIGEAGWHATYEDILDLETIETAMDAWYNPETTREFVDREEVGYYVAQRNGKILGYVSGGPSDDPAVAVLGAIYVDPDHWGEGAGTALLDAFEEFCRNHDYETVQLRVLAENDIGISFYRKHGYERVETETTELFGERAPECLFRKSLA